MNGRVKQQGFLGFSSWPTKRQAGTLSRPIRSALPFPYGFNVTRRTTMPDKSSYETGARKLPAKQDADASVDFSQAAAGNRRPEGVWA
jgi:hypothetical protein